MNRNSASTRTRWWLAAALSFVALRALPNLSYPLGNDQATYAVIGRGLLEGRQLYRDLWDMKPPAIYWIYALIVKAFGTVMWSVGLVDIVWLMVISFCTFYFARRFLGTAAAVIATAVNASLHCTAGALNAAEPEGFFILFIFASYFVAEASGPWNLPRQFAAGALLGGAFWLKYNAAVFLPFILIGPCFDWNGLDVHPLRFKLLVPWPTWFKRSAAYLAGLATVVLTVVFYLYLAGLWQTFWESHIRVASQYGTSALHIPDYWAWIVASTILGPGAFSVSFGVLSVFAPFVAWSIASRKRELSRLGPILAAAALGYLSVASQLRFPPSGYEACYPFFAMVWAYLTVKTYEWAQSVRRQPAFRRRRLTAVLTSAAFASLACWILVGQGMTLARRYRALINWWRDPGGFYLNYPEKFGKEPLREKMLVIAYLKAKSHPGDQVYVWGFQALIYYLTGLRSPTRFVPNFPLMSSWGPPAWRSELMRDLHKSHPAFIVVERHDAVVPVTLSPLDSEQYLKVFPELAGFIRESYRPAATFFDFVVYERKPSST